MSEEQRRCIGMISLTCEEFGKLRNIMRTLLWGKHTEMRQWLEIVQSIEERYGEQPFDYRP